MWAKQIFHSTSVLGILLKNRFWYIFLTILSLHRFTYIGFCGWNLENSLRTKKSFHTWKNDSNSNSKCKKLLYIVLRCQTPSIPKFTNQNEKTSYPNTRKVLYILASQEKESSRLRNLLPSKVSRSKPSVLSIPLELIYTELCSPTLVGSLLENVGLVLKD